MTSDSVSRVTRSRRSLRLAVLLFLGALAAATVLRAQEPPKATATPAAPAPAGEPAAEPPVAASAAGAEGTAPESDKAAPAAETDRKPASASSGRFEPTEKVRADFDVSFPVDI
jgi:nucleoid-associated protein YgaU